MARKRKLEIEITGDASSAQRAFSTTGTAASTWQQKISRAGRNVAIGLAGIGVAAGVMGLDFVRAAEESQKVTAQTEAVIKSMGDAAGISAEGVAALSEKLSMQSGIDDELIQSGENVLLTFRNVRNEVGKGNDIFTRATTAALDMSVAMDQDLQSSVVQIGKALNDPIAGLTSLTRVGVQFTDQQKDQIKAMVEAGDVAGAQKIILEELEAQFGGSAEAQATASDKLAVAWDNLKETLGEKLLPVVESFSTWVTDTGIPAIEALVGWIEENQTAVKIFAGIVAGILVVALLAWAAAATQAAIATIAATWPVLAIIAALALLAAAVIYAYTHWGWFKAAVDAVARFVTEKLWPALRTLAGWITGTLIPTIGNIITKMWSWATAAFNVGAKIVQYISGVLSWIAGIPRWIADVGRGMWEGLKSGLVAVVNWIIRRLNEIVNALDTLAGPFINFPSIPQLSGSSGGGGSVSYRRSPRPMAEGGIVPATPGGMFTQLGEGRWDEAVIPLTPEFMSGSWGGDTITYEINVTVEGSVRSDRELVDVINDQIARGNMLTVRGRRL